MPAKSKAQFRYIQMLKHRYGSKEETPDEHKWVWEGEWTDNVDYSELPKEAAAKPKASAGKLDPGVAPGAPEPPLPDYQNTANATAYKQPDGSVLTRISRRPGETPDAANNRIFQEWYKPYLKEEGGKTKDSGGYTAAGGVAETSGLAKKQLQRMTPAEREQWYRARFQGMSPWAYKDSESAKLLNTVGNNSSPQWAIGQAQKLMGLKPSGWSGPATSTAVQHTDNTNLARGLQKAWEARHNTLLQEDPKKYGENAAGWENRRKAISKALPPGLGIYEQQAPPAVVKSGNVDAATGIGGVAATGAAALGLHKGVPYAADYLMRRNPVTRKPFENYYANASKAGLEAGMTGKDVMPVFRRAVGGIAPTVTGLADYEFSKMLGKGVAKAAPGINPSTIQNVAQHVNVPANNASPLWRNVANSQHAAPSPVVNFLSRTKGVDRQMLGGTGVGLTGAVTGGLMHGPVGAVAGLAGAGMDAAAVELANRNKMNTLLWLKESIMRAGGGNKLNGVARTALGVFDPMSKELYDAGSEASKVVGPKLLDRSLDYLSNHAPHKLSEAVVKDFPVLERLRPVASRLTRLIR